MTPHQTRNAAATRAALLTAASRCFAAHGFAGARTQAIADAAGVNKALIRYYFDGKQGLYSAVLLDHIERAQNEIAAALDDEATPPERLDAFIVAVAHYMGESSDFASIIMREQMDGARRLVPEVRERFFRFFGVVRGILEEGIAQGHFRSLDPHATHLSLIGSLVMFDVTRPARATYRQAGHIPAPTPTWSAYVDHVRRLFRVGLKPTGEMESKRSTESGD